MSTTPLYSVSCPSYGTIMSPALTYIIFGTANIIGSQPAVPGTAPGLIPNTIQEALQLQATRYNYTYTAGVGFHKVHTDLKNWNTARRTCLEEGGHLAIINSAAEAGTIARLLKTSNLEWGHIGFHDLFQEGDYVTIHGESLAKAGYEGWRAGEPNNWDNNEHCGVLSIDGTLNDGRCEHEANFICELSTHVQQPCLTQNQPPPQFTRPPVDLLDFTLRKK